MNKIQWLDAAEIFDSWRVVPRVILFGYCLWIAHVTDSVLLWYERLPGAERSLESAGLATAIITAVTGLFPWIYKIYSDTGRDWSAGANSSSSTVTMTRESK